ncbi:uncharacterized protein PG998_014950 [Apiospora kogelbergensis]|uniref:uncharacterized protein n=1 Tax=Apiospora kogelbergensis TaxID=1337665 RepID=UPI00312D7EFF
MTATIPPNEHQASPVQPEITPVSSESSGTVPIGDEDRSGVEVEPEREPKGDGDLEKKSTTSIASGLGLWEQISSELDPSLHPSGLYKSSCHLWHVLKDYWWLWELATMSMSFASMTAVIIILAVEDGKSLDDWPLPIQPNSLISIFITLCKSAIMTALTGAISQSMWIQFEQKYTQMSIADDILEAGRGPWGSLNLLKSKMKGKHFNLLAIMGALITVVTLAFDPFVQQVMSFPTRTIQSRDGKAIFKLSQHLVDMDMTLVQGAILGGVYRNPQITNYTCTESSCSWPTITTLGVCSSCQDLTARAAVQCSTSLGPLMPSPSSDPWTFETTNCNYTVDGNITIPTYIQTLSFPMDKNGRQAEYASQWTKIKLLPQEGYDNYSAKNQLGKMISPDISPDINYWFTTVLTYSTFFDSRTNPLPKVTPDLLAPRIIACGLRPCGHVWRNATVVNGTLANNGIPTSSVPLRALFSDDGGLGHYNLPNRFDPNDMLVVDNDAHSEAFPGNGTFVINHSGDLTGLLTRIYRATSLEGNGGFGDAFPESESGMYGITNAIFDADFVAAASAAATATVDSPGASFARAARGLSEYVRSGIRINYDGIGDEVEENKTDWNNGKAWRQETYIKVQWAFMTLPLLVLVATLALLGAAIRRSMDKGARVWKSSSLALLFHEVGYDKTAAESSTVSTNTENAGAETKDSDGKGKGVAVKIQQIEITRQWPFKAESVKDMNSKADEMEARLGNDADKLRFLVK